MSISLATRSAHPAFATVKKTASPLAGLSRSQFHPDGGSSIVVVEVIQDCEPV